MGHTKMVKSQKRKKPAILDVGAVRSTISFPSDMYQTLEEVARKKKVSLAWVVREAAEQYIADKWPLFAAEERRD